ncbi:MAG: transposase [Ginsengibacter sp.]
MEKFKPINNEKLFLLPPSITDFIAEGHLARIINEIVDTIDVSEIESRYNTLGQKSYSPRLLLKLPFYAYSTGIRSGRKIAACCEQDTAFMYLAAMYKPDFRTINDFRKNNIPFIQKAFLHIAQICRELGMCKAGMRILDGSKLKANANASITKTKQQYEQWLKKIDEEIKIILDHAAKEDRDEDQHYGTTKGITFKTETKNQDQI